MKPGPGCAGRARQPTREHAARKIRPRGLLPIHQAPGVRLAQPRRRRRRRRPRRRRRGRDKGLN
eukprot:scaffold1883_cov396-Prasinococcus_capsulatus_cf.AAC.1